MREYINNILQEIDSEIDNFDFYDCNIIENSLKMINWLETILKELRKQIADYTFCSKEEEILFFKEQKPEILSRLLFFDKVYQIESMFPNGSDEVVHNYLNDKLASLTFFFNRNLDFYQYYRSKSTIYDEYYFIRGRADIRLCSDSSRLDRDPNFSTGFDFKVAKILAYEMLRIYINKRLQNLGKEKNLEDIRAKYAKNPISFTGKKIALIEIGYSLASVGDINHGNIEIKELMNYLGAMFNVDLGDYYAAYIAMKGRKKDRTVYLNHLSQSLQKRMDEDDEK